MTAVTVIINDFETDRRSITTLEEGDFEIVDQNWQKEDALLDEMQDNPIFAGKRRWCDLDPMQFRAVITLALSKVGALSDQDRVNRLNPTVFSLNFLIGGLVTCLEKRCDCRIELLRINRIKESEASFDFTAALNLALEITRPTGLKVIIDNTD